GDAPLAELIQTLILLIPLGIGLALAFPHSRRERGSGGEARAALAAVEVGALLSFGIEFAQQYIPGRDPSVGDIVSNTISTALGVLLVVAAPIWLWAPPRRSAWQARLASALAVLVWYGTGAMLQQAFPPRPYRMIPTPNSPKFRHYMGKIIKVTPAERTLEVRAVAAPYPPDRTSPLIAVLSRTDERALL